MTPVIDGYFIKRDDEQVLCWHHIIGYYFDNYKLRGFDRLVVGTKKQIEKTFKYVSFDFKERCKICKFELKEVEMQ